MSDQQPEQPQSAPVPTPKYSQKEYTVRVLTDEGKVVEKKIRLNLARQVRPAGVAPVPTPVQGQVNEEVATATLERFREAVKETAEDGASHPVMGALLTVLAKKEDEPDAVPTVHGGLVKLSSRFIDLGYGSVAVNTQPDAPPVLTREEAAQKLLGYLGQGYTFKDGEILDENGIIATLADNLGALVSNLDGTEQFAQRILRSAKHPRFYFRGAALRRARSYLDSAQVEIDEFSWKYADEDQSVALIGLHRAQAFIQNAISALTGRGFEQPVHNKDFDEDGRITPDRIATDGSVNFDLVSMSSRVIAQKTLDKLEEVEEHSTAAAEDHFDNEGGFLSIKD